MARLRFLVPSIMCGGILLGTLAAVAHHLFYQSLNGKIVHSDNQQQWFFRIGTGLSFLAKTLLTASAALAYTQILWQTLRLRPISLHGVDSLFGAVTSAWNFTDLELWRSGPTLAIIALIVWTLPLISVITPATLTVRIAAHPNQTIYNVPIPSIDYGRIEDQRFALLNDRGPPTYIGPAQRIMRLMSSITSQGAILQIPAPFPNCTYSILFYGPSISCGPTPIGDTSFQEDVGKLINHYNTAGMIFYVGFVPKNLGGTGTAPSDLAPVGLNVTLGSPNDIVNPPFFDEESKDHARFYAATLKPGLISSSRNNQTYETFECGLYNTSYVVDFTFNNGLQDIIVTNMTQLNGVYSGYELDQCGGWITGTCGGPSKAYYSIMDAFSNQMIGYVENSYYGHPIGVRTQLMNSVLMETTEIQQSMKASYRQPLSIANMTLAQAFEQTVLNATLSLFSDPYFLQNSTTASILPVLVSSAQNAYMYSSRNLIMSYGIGIFIAAAVVMVGIACIWTSGDSFGASFSTILRTTRNTEFDAIIQPGETDGAFPLSKQLGDTKLILRRYGDTRTAFALADTARSGDQRSEWTETGAKGPGSSDSLSETMQRNTAR